MEGEPMRLEHDRNRNWINANHRECIQCGRRLGEFYREDICPSCKEFNLFLEVKEYIRTNNVKEMDVAEHFNIPVSKVRTWIREGRIVYKTSDGKTISGVYCQICGKKIEFGTVCPKCLRLQQLQVISKQYNEMKSDEMHFLGRSKRSNVDNK